MNPKQDKLKEFHTRHIIIKLLKIIRTIKRYLELNVKNPCKNTCDSAKAYFRGKFIALFDSGPFLNSMENIDFFFFKSSNQLLYAFCSGFLLIFRRRGGVKYAYSILTRIKTLILSHKN